MAPQHVIPVLEPPWASMTWRDRARPTPLPSRLLAGRNLDSAIGRDTVTQEGADLNVIVNELLLEKLSFGHRSVQSTRFSMTSRRIVVSKQDQRVLLPSSALCQLRISRASTTALNQRFT